MPGRSSIPGKAGKAGNAGKLAAWLFCLCLALPGLDAARAQPLPAGRELLLQVWINGFDTGKLASFTERSGALYATRSDLAEFGLIVPASIPAANPVALNALTGIGYRVDERSQSLRIQARNEALEPRILKVMASERPASSLPVENGSGAVLNYDAVITQGGGGRQSAGAYLDGRWFGGPGVAATGLMLATHQPNGGVVRLDSTFTHGDEASLTKYQFGDFISDGLSWNRPVRLGGLQMSTDFSMRPDLVTFPVPRIVGGAAVPSTVDVLVNDVRQLSRDLPPGPFEIRQIPVSAGVGEVAVSVRDSLGRTTVQTLPFYGTGRLLAEGRSTQSLQIGAVRRNFGLRSNDYHGVAGGGSLRHGWSDSLTFEGHAEVAQGLVNAGGGAVVSLGRMGLISGSVSASQADPVYAAAGGARSGVQAGIAYERVAKEFSVSASVQGASPGYRDIAAVNGAPAPRSSRRLGVSAPLPGYGTLGLTHVSVRRGDDLPGSTAPAGGGETRLWSLVHSYALSERMQMFTTVYTGAGQSSANRGFFVGLAYLFGNGASANASTSSSGSRLASTLQTSRPALHDGDLGWQALATAGPYTRAMGEAEYRTRYGSATLGVDSLNGVASARVGMRGAVVATAGRVALAAPLPGAFAVVDTDGHAGVPVFYENRPAGETDSRGFLLLPNLRAYDANRVAIDPLGLDADIELASPSRFVRPADRAGVPVRFPLRRAAAALLTLVDPAGQPLPIGTVVELAGGAAKAGVGHDGQVYLEGLAADNRFTAVSPTGTRCGAAFAFDPPKGDIARIGPLKCVPLS